MLDSKQAAQVLANREQIRHGRLRTVTLIRNDGGATAYGGSAVYVEGGAKRILRRGKS